MQSFKKLLESVRSTNPGLISEEAADQMLTDYENGINQIKSDALAEGQALGFKEGYDEGKRIAQDEAKKALDELTEKLDQEATEKVKSIIEMLNEQHAEKLQSVYDMLKEQTVPRAEYDQLDADCASKLKEVYECTLKKAADDKAAALEEAAEKANVKMEAREGFHSKKLKAVKLLLEEKVVTAEKALQEEKERKLDILSEQVEKYLNYALAEKIPTKQIISEQKYAAANKTIEKISSILKLNHILQESKDGIFNDYEAEIQKQKDQSNKLLVENADLKSKLNKQEARIMLEEKIAKCVPSEAAFLRTYFKNADSKKIIEEQIDDARAVFKRLHAEKRANLVKEQEKQAVVKPTAVVVENKETAKKEEPVVETPQVVAESVETANNFNSVYVSLLSNK